MRFEQHMTQERSIGIANRRTADFDDVFLCASLLQSLTVFPPSSCHYVQLSRRIKRHTTPAKSDKSLRVTNLKITQVLCQLSEALKEETVRNKKGTWLNTGILSGHDQDTVMTLYLSEHTEPTIPNITSIVLCLKRTPPVLQEQVFSQTLTTNRKKRLTASLSGL